jgi:GTP-binding protein of the ras superfamily involved in termination of M-phase
MEKTVQIRAKQIQFSCFDMGGKESSLLPLVCNDAVALLFTFDLTRPGTLVGLRDRYLAARALNQVH